MPDFNCQYELCKKEFYSKHSTAKFCSRKCSGMSNSDRFKTEKQKKTNEELLSELVNLSIKLNKTPSKKDMERSECSDASIYRKRFGSWNQAVIAAGLQPNLCSPSGHTESISLSLRFKVLKRDNFRCVYCGGTPEQGYILHADHVTPRSKGGKTSGDNLVTSCSSCNLGKSNSV